MLTITIPGQEFFDEVREVFVNTPTDVVHLEHSLLSLSKWESEFCKPFLSSTEKTDTEVLRYIELMVLADQAPVSFLGRLTRAHYEEINEYMNSPRSATMFYDQQKSSGKGETITAELIYYWLSAFHIPFECETWHLNRLFALIRIASIKNSPPKKMSANELARRNHELNEQRKQMLGTSG